MRKNQEKKRQHTDKYNIRGRDQRPERYMHSARYDDVQCDCDDVEDDGGGGGGDEEADEK